MEANVGSVDRGVRVVIGLALLGCYCVERGRSMAGHYRCRTSYDRGVPVCPLYRLVGLSTCPLAAKK